MRRIANPRLGRVDEPGGTTTSWFDTPEHDIAGANAGGFRSVLIIEPNEMGHPRGDVQAQHTIREIPELLSLV